MQAEGWRQLKELLLWYVLSDLTHGNTWAWVKAETSETNISPIKCQHTQMNTVSGSVHWEPSSVSILFICTDAFTSQCQLWLVKASLSIVITSCLILPKCFTFTSFSLTEVICCRCNCYNLLIKQLRLREVKCLIYSKEMIQPTFGLR